MKTKPLIIAFVIALLIGWAAWYFLSVKNTAEQIRWEFGSIKPSFSLTSGLTLDIDVNIQNPTEKSISVQNFDLVGTLNGSSAGAIVPGKYAVDVAANATSILKVKYQIGMAALLGIVGGSAFDYLTGTALKDVLKGKVFDFNGTLKAEGVTVPLSTKVDLSTYF